MKVLILGATGFIGFPTAQAFVRAGHEVYGQTRNNDKTKNLEAEEIIPVVADPANSSAWAQIAEKVDVVIDCVGGNDIATLSETVFTTAVAAAKRARGDLKPKLTYIYCSGTWVHGDDRRNSTSERSPPKNTTSLVTWRTAREQAVLAETAVDSIVVRPALLYGRSGSITAMLFGEAAKAASENREIAWPGRAGGRWAAIHCDDLADFFVRIAEAAPI